VVDATTSSVGTAVVIVLPPVTVVIMVVYRRVEDETRGVVMVVALFTEERLMVEATELDPMTTISEEVALDDLVEDVFVLWPDDAREEAAEEPDWAAEEDWAAVVWLAEEPATEEGAAELVFSAIAEDVADVDGATSDELMGSLVGVVTGVEAGASLVVGAADDVGTVVVEGGSLVEVGGVEVVVSRTVEEVVGGTDDVELSTTAEEVCAVEEVLAPVPTSEFWRLSIHGRLFAFAVWKTMMSARSRAIRLSERGIVCDMQKSCRLQVIGVADRTDEKCLSKWLPESAILMSRITRAVEESGNGRVVSGYLYVNSDKGYSCTSCDAIWDGAMKTSGRRENERRQNQYAANGRYMSR
jgi:hypothetical protein